MTSLRAAAQTGSCTHSHEYTAHKHTAQAHERWRYSLAGYVYGNMLGTSRALGTDTHELHSEREDEGCWSYTTNGVTLVSFDRDQQRIEGPLEAGPPSGSATPPCPQLKDAYARDGAAGVCELGERHVLVASSNSRAASVYYLLRHAHIAADIQDGVRCLR